MKKKHYQVKFGILGQPTIGDVSFDASHDANAKKRAEAIGRELGLPRTAYQLYEGFRLVHSREQQY